MQTLTVQITNSNALRTLHNLEEKRYIKIVEDSNIDSPSLPGKQLSLKAFKSWISDAETSGSVDLTEARTKWQNKRKHLQKLIK